MTAHNTFIAWLNQRPLLSNSLKLVMEKQSRLVISRQTAPHEQLAAHVYKHWIFSFQKPIADFNQAAWAHAQTVWGKTRPLILDAGCGVGLSTIYLAQQFPDHFVLGIDRSDDRLLRGKPWLKQQFGLETPPENCAWIRADLADIWRLMAQDGVQLARHYWLYPNPYPKPKHLGLRWSGHPVLPTALSLGGVLCCRSNWRVYVEELAQAICYLSAVRGCLTPVNGSEQPLTFFERKYAASGQALWQYEVDLRAVTLGWYGDA